MPDNSYKQKEHILVCLSPAPSNGHIVRTAARMAAAFGASFTAVYVQTLDYELMSGADKERLKYHSDLAGSLGAQVVTLYSDDVPGQIAEYARISAVTKIVLGRSMSPHRLFFRPVSITEKLMEAAPDRDVYIIPDKSASYYPPGKKIKSQDVIPDFINISKTLAILVLTTVIGILFSKINVAVVQGLGPVGIFAVMYLKKIGVKKVYAITAGNNEKREQLALELGADKVFNLSAGTAEVTAELQKENCGLGVDLCFEASGAPQAVVQGMDILRNRGVYLVPGQYSASGGIEIQPQMITFKALHIIGSSQYSMCDVDKYLKFLVANPDLHTKIEKLANKYTIDKINEAFADAKAGNNIKTMLVK